MEGIDEVGLSNPVDDWLNQTYNDVAALFKKRAHSTPITSGFTSVT
jgi:hypothetical protein